MFSDTLHKGINTLPVQLFGVRIDTISLGELLSKIKTTIKSKQKSLIANVNINAINLACTQPWFRDFLNGSDIVFCDGYGVMLGARLLGKKINERITYADWTWDIAELAEKEGFSIYLLGGKPGVAEKAGNSLIAKHPNLVICGTRDGYFDKKVGSQENQMAVEDINQCHPNILIVSFGMPLQEKWIQENLERLEVNVLLPVGAALDYISGEVRRGPRWMTDHGLEWLARMIIEPRRLWKRYLIGNPLFFWRVLKQRLGWLKFDDPGG